MTKTIKNWVALFTLLFFTFSAHSKIQKSMVVIEPIKGNFQNSFLKDEVLKNALRTVIMHEKYDFLLEQTKKGAKHSKINYLELRVNKSGHTYNLEFKLKEKRKGASLKRVRLKRISENQIIYKSNQLLYRLFYGKEAPRTSMEVSNVDDSAPQPIDALLEELKEEQAKEGKPVKFRKKKPRPKPEYALNMPPINNIPPQTKRKLIQEDTDDDDIFRVTKVNLNRAAITPTKKIEKKFEVVFGTTMAQADSLDQLETGISYSQFLVGGNVIIPTGHDYKDYFTLNSAVRIPITKPLMELRKYKKTIEFEKALDFEFFQSNYVPNYDLFYEIGAAYDQNDFANLESANSGISIGRASALWLMGGIKKAREVFSKQVRYGLRVGYSLATQTEYAEDGEKLNLSGSKVRVWGDIRLFKDWGALIGYSRTSLNSQFKNFSLINEVINVQGQYYF